MAIHEEIKKLRSGLESKKPMLALPPSSLQVVEITDTKSPEFKRAMEIYRKTFPEEEREEEYKIARYVRNTQKTGRMDQKNDVEFHLIAIKDNSVSGEDKIIGQAQISYFPGKRHGAIWYVSMDPSRRDVWKKLVKDLGSSGARKLVEDVGNFKKQMTEYASKHGEKPFGAFFDIEPSKKAAENLMRGNSYVFTDIEFEIPAVRRGGGPIPTRFAFIPYGNVELPGWALKNIIADYMKAGFNVGKNIDKNPQYQNAIKNIDDDHLYRFAKKS